MPAGAARTVDNATLDYFDPPTNSLYAGSVEVTVTTDDSGGGDAWDSTRLEWLDPSDNSTVISFCSSQPDPEEDAIGEHDETIPFASPPAAGPWSLRVTAFGDDQCTVDAGDVPLTVNNILAQPDNNPDLPLQCGIDLILVLDESGSIDGEDTGLVRAAANAFVDSLKNTGARLGIVEFATHAQQVIPQPDNGTEYPPPGGGNSSADCPRGDLYPWDAEKFSRGIPKGQPIGLDNGTFMPNVPLLVVNDANESLFDDYIGVPPGEGDGYPGTWGTGPGNPIGDNYRPNLRNLSTDCRSHSHIGIYTNWEYALEVSNRLQNKLAGPDKADAIIVFTDGAPNRWLVDTGGVGGGTGIGGPDNASAPAPFREVAVTEASGVADTIKDNGTKIISLGVGAVFTREAALEALKAVSGPDTIDNGALFAPETDTILITNFDDLGETFRDIALALCTNSLSIVKQFDPDGGPNDCGDPNLCGPADPQDEPGWGFLGDVNVHQFGGGVADCEAGSSVDNSHDFTWVQADAAGRFGDNVTPIMPGAYAGIGTRAEFDVVTDNATATATLQWLPGVGGTDNATAAQECKSYVRFLELPITGAYTANNGNTSNDPQFGFVSAQCVRTNLDNATKETMFDLTLSPDNASVFELSNFDIDDPQSGSGITDQIVMEPLDVIRCTVINDPGPDPVDLSKVKVKKTGNGLRYKWKTATETNTLGFNLWARSEVDGKWHRVNDRPVPSKSKGGTSLSPRKYRKRIRKLSRKVPGEIVAAGIESVDLDRTKRMYRPLRLNQKYGSSAVPDPIPWGRIKKKLDDDLGGKGFVKKGDKWLPPADTGTDPGGSAALTAFSAVDVAVTRSGMQRVTYEDIAALDFDLSGIPVDAIAVTHMGLPVARWIGPSPGDFAPGDTIEFWGEEVSGEAAQYTAENIYRIEVDPGAVSVARVIAAEPQPGDPSYEAVLFQNEQSIYNFSVPTDDPWLARWAVAHGGENPSPADMVVDLQIDNLIENTPAVLDLGLIGITNWPGGDDHNVEVFLNGQSLASESNDGLVVWPMSILVPADVLREGSNTVIVRVTAAYDWDVVALDTVTLRYDRSLVAQGDALRFNSGEPGFAISGFSSSDVIAYSRQGNNLTRIATVDTSSGAGGVTAAFAGTGRTAEYWASTEAALNSPSVSPSYPASGLLAQEGDYLIISHPLFADTLESSGYLAQKSSEGYSPTVVDIKAIESAYGHGMPIPEAITRYLAAAKERFDFGHVLLAGGATSDPRNYTGSGSMNFVPTAFVRSGDFIYHAPNDGPIFDLDGNGAPDVAGGRWPARTVEELQTIIKKTLDYTNNGMGGDRSAILLADAQDPNLRGSDFSQQAEAMSLRMSTPSSPGEPAAPWTDIERIYLDDYETVEKAQNALVAAVNAGAGHTLYAGHASPSGWSFQGLLNWSMVDEFTNVGMPTLVSTMACYTTYFVSPSNQTLGHQLLMGGDYGAVAVHGASVLSNYSENGVMASAVLNRMFSGDETLGEAVLHVKQELANHPNLQGPVSAWQVNGDPTIRAGN